MTAAFSIEVLGPGHNRSGFSSGVEALDRYFREQVTQDMRRRATACYVAVEAATAKIAGYYTLAAGGVPLAEMPEKLAKRLPRYPSVPVARLGRLAVDRAYRGQKLGAALLWDATVRALRSEVAVLALVVDAKDQQAEAFYRHHGFIAFGSASGQALPSPHESHHEALTRSACCGQAILAPPTGRLGLFPAEPHRKAVPSHM